MDPFLNMTKRGGVNRVKKLLSIVLAMSFLIVLFPAPSRSAGGCGPFFASCCLGPRVGLEMNEGKPINVLEWLRLIIPAPIMAIFQGGKENGVKGYFASCCIGPRVGQQLDKRKIRTLEWLRLVPVVNIVAAIMVSVEAGSGKTMVEIEKAEGLKR
jgi:hypothetical protein